MKGIVEKHNKKHSLAIIIVIVSLISFLGILDIRITPLGALKANYFTKDIIEILVDIG